MKRRRLNSGGSVTGGTGDIKPQILTEQVIQPAVDDYSVLQIVLPVPRFGGVRTKSTIFEILKVYWYPGMEDDADINKQMFGFLATTNLGRTNGDTSSTATFAVDILQSNIISAYSYSRFTSTNGGSARIMPITQDLTDNNGNGVLVATDKMFLIMGSSGETTLTSLTAKVLYRTVNVGIDEYVGIVQSQLQ